MDKYFVVILLILVFSQDVSSISYYEPKSNIVVKKNKNPNDLVKIIISRNHIDIDSKSYNGWIRVFSSDKKIGEYGIILWEGEKEIMLKYWKSKSEKNKLPIFYNP